MENIKFSLIILDCQILNWENKLKTGMLLGSVNLLFFSMIFLKMSLISLLAYLALFYLIGGIAAVKFMHKSQEQEANTTETEYFPRKNFEDAIKILMEIASQYESIVKRACSLEDLLFSAKVKISIFLIKFFFN